MRNPILAPAGAVMLFLAGIFINYSAYAKKARTIHLNDNKTETIFITPGRSTILNFPTRPTKVILGNQGQFTVEYVESDLAVAATRAPASSNLFVYLEGRRFGFDLRTVPAGGDEIVLVRDAEGQKIKVRMKE
jgi:hypothetical protein